MAIAALLAGLLIVGALVLVAAQLLYVVVALLGIWTTGVFRAMCHLLMPIFFRIAR